MLHSFTKKTRVDLSEMGLLGLVPGHHNKNFENPRVFLEHDSARLRVGILENFLYHREERGLIDLGPVG